jgi:hypothetical protein
MPQSQPSYDDVKLILKLYDMRREAKLRAARAWFSASFKVKSLAEYNTLCPSGSEPNAYARQVMTYWDMVGSFITSGVLNQELFFESGRELLFVWTRVQPMIAELRQSIQDPNFLKHLETVGKAFAAHFEKTNREAYQNWVARVQAA